MLCEMAELLMTIEFFVYFFLFKKKLNFHFPANVGFVRTMEIKNIFMAKNIQN